jgi:flagellar basal-body rod modification protein FlgD
MSTDAISASGLQAQQATDYDAYSELNLDDFLQMFITELSNQDPLNPMDSQAIVEQMSQIQEIESNKRLTETLETVLLGQSMSTASALIDRTITGLTDDGETITGRVDRVSVAEGKPKLHVGDDAVALTNVSEIVAKDE